MTEDPIDRELRLRWQENGRKEREFWTHERLCLSWMQGSTPDESDMRWWASQPQYRRRLWLSMRKDAGELAQRERKPLMPFHLYDQMVQERGEQIEREDESLTERFLGYIREDFLAGRPCSISLEGVFEPQLHRSERCLKEALRRAGIPDACLGRTTQPTT